MSSPLMLGVSGLRGIAGKSLTPEIARRYARGFAAWLGEHAMDDRPLQVVVARDGRQGGEVFQRAAIDALVNAGVNIIDIGIAMTPTAAVMVDHHSAAGGLIITASHNPQEWNGLKCLVRAAPGDAAAAAAAAPSASQAQAIIAAFESGLGSEHAQISGRIEGFGDAAAVHVAKVMAALAECGGFHSSRRWRVVLDSVNASGIEGGRRLLVQSLACELIHHGAEESGIFPHPPEPTGDNLSALATAVSRFNAEVGFAQDPDGDRLALVDERGRCIGEEYTLALAAQSILSADESIASKRAVLVTNLSTSRLIEDVAARYGGGQAQVIRTPVGEANVVQAMKREAAAGRHVVLGGEGNGGVIWPRVAYVRDSLGAMALVLSLVARSGRKLSELVADLPRYAIVKRKLDLARKEDAGAAVEKLAAVHRGQRVDLQDGVRVDFVQGPLAGRAWLHVRASNTEPILRLIAEAPSEAEAGAIVDEAAGVVVGV